MKTLFTQTSLWAYDNVKTTLGERHHQVLHALGDLGEATNGEIGQRLGWTPNRVTGRVNELRKKGKVEYVRTRACKVTGFQAKVWRLRDL